MSERAARPVLDEARFAELWDVVTSLPAGERERYLERSGTDAALRGELESLLRNVAPAADFFTRLSEAVPGVVRAAALADAADAADATSASLGSSRAAGDARVPGDTVAHYRIEELLGAGGMGVVYRAHDTRLERTVALKFLSPRWHADPLARERFLVEARAAAALDHPNICTIHEVGGSGGTALFIAMAHYPGETLEQVLRRGPLPLELALDYATQIVRGLAAAHARGIIHGDVKPGNVLITSDQVVKLLDFGIARLAGAAAGGHAVPGTVAYMAPEQVTSMAGDQRIDLWSLGVVLYEMCTGVRPFRGADHAEVLRRVASERAEPPSGLRPELAPELEAIILRLLEKAPAARYASAEATLAALLAERARLEGGAGSGAPPRPRRRGALALVPVLLLLLGAGALSLRGGHEASRVLVGDAEGDTAAGRVVAERLRQRLAAPDLVVMGQAALTPVLARMGRAPATRLTPETAREIAIREGLPSFVHLTVDRIGAAFTLGAVLVDAKSGDFLDHQQAVALAATELPAAADRLARALRRTVGGRQGGTADRRGGPPPLAVTTDSLSALRLHLEAVQANRSGDFRRGVQLEDEALDVDPGFADAHQTRAFALEQIGLRAGAAQNSILRAAALRERLARHERYLVEADYRWQIDGNLEGAIAALRNAHSAIDELEPGRVLNRRSYGLALMLHGDLVEAEHVLQEGRQYATCPATNTHLVSVLHALGKEREARTVLAQALDQWPTNPLLGMDRAHFLANARNYRAAHAEAARLERDYTLPFALRAEAVFDAVEGRLDEAIRHLAELRDRQVRAGLLPPALEAAAAIGRLRLVQGDTAAARGEVSAFIARHPLRLLPAAERPYLSLALFYADARDPRRARALVAEYDTAVPRLYQGPDAWMQHRAAGAIALAENRPADALRAFRIAARSDRIWTSWLDNLLFTMDARPELAHAYERLGQPDSAIATLERYLAARVLYRAELDAFHLAHVLRRLAVLHAQRNEFAAAAAYRRQLGALWNGADPAVKRAWSLFLDAGDARP